MWYKCSKITSAERNARSSYVFRFRLRIALLCIPPDLWLLLLLLLLCYARITDALLIFMTAGEARASVPRLLPADARARVFPPAPVREESSAETQNSFFWQGFSRDLLDSTCTGSQI